MSDKKPYLLSYVSWDICLVPYGKCNLSWEYLDKRNFPNPTAQKENSAQCSANFCVSSNKSQCVKVITHMKTLHCMLKGSFRYNDKSCLQMFM